MRHLTSPSRLTTAPSSPRPRTGELAWWDLRSRKKTRRLAIETGPHALAVSPDGLTAAVGIDHGLQLVDMDTGAVRTATHGLTGTPNWVLFSPDGETVVSTNLDGTVTLWDVESATPRDTLRGHSNSVQQPVFSPDGTTLYTVSHDGTAIAWDLTAERGLGRPFRFTHDRTFNSAGYDGHPGEFSPDGRLIAVGLKKRGIALWDARAQTRRGAPSRNERRGQGARLLTGWANACGRDRPRTLSHALGRRFAIAAP
jgi:WD40 repeat protein